MECFIVDFYGWFDVGFYLSGFLVLFYQYYLVVVGIIVGIVVGKLVWVVFDLVFVVVYCQFVVVIGFIC